VILVAQDTTTLAFTSLKQTSWLAMLEQAHTRGLVVHSVLAMTREGTPLGLLHSRSGGEILRRGARALSRFRSVARRELVAHSEKAGCILGFFPRRPAPTARKFKNIL
jgi:hypothetical protein